MLEIRHYQCHVVLVPHICYQRDHMILTTRKKTRKKAITSNFTRCSLLLGAHLTHPLTLSP